MEDFQSYVVLRLKEETPGRAGGPLDEFEQSLKERPDVSEEAKKQAMDLMKSYFGSPVQQPAPSLFASEYVTLNLPHRIYEDMLRPQIGQTVLLKLSTER